MYSKGINNTFNGLEMLQFASSYGRRREDSCGISNKIT